MPEQDGPSQEIYRLTVAAELADPEKAINAKYEIWEALRRAGATAIDVALEPGFLKTVEEDTENSGVPEPEEAALHTLLSRELSTIKVDLITAPGSIAKTRKVLEDAGVRTARDM